MKDSNRKFRVLEGQGWTIENGLFKRNGFEIGFYHYYYTVEGRVPLDIAEEIYAHPIGKGDVRAGGHCGCEEPVKHILHFDKDGTKLAHRPEYEKLLQQLGEIKEGSFAERCLKDFHATHRVVDFLYYDQAFVTIYHIDSEAGLLLFVETLKKHGLL